jgi:hypothetical protein
MPGKKEERPRETGRPGRNPDPVTEDDQLDEARRGKRRNPDDKGNEREEAPDRERQAPRQGEEQGGGGRRDR